ncbi:MAG: hypothetical protein GSR83_00105 [Desulfurococcales archaeon]|nr:hypothetical protein [Desulfurococcales archaeon]
MARYKLAIVILSAILVISILASSYVYLEHKRALEATLRYASTEAQLNSLNLRHSGKNLLLVKEDLEKYNCSLGDFKRDYPERAVFDGFLLHSMKTRMDGLESSLTIVYLVQGESMPVKLAEALDRLDYYFSNLDTVYMKMYGSNGMFNCTLLPDNETAQRLDTVFTLIYNSISQSKNEKGLFTGFNETVIDELWSVASSLQNS